MPEPLKYLYNQPLLEKLAKEMQKHYTAFNKEQFLNRVFDKQWEERELKQRMRHITHCLHAALPMSYAKQLHVLRKAAPHFNGFIAILFPDFVEVYGLDYPEISITALGEFTQYSSSEFAVRPFIVRYEKQMLSQHMKWAKDKNHHVRRLASEGIRPRLPWAMALPAFKQDPSKIIPVLELLKNDSSEYVRRSVANCLNDISKDHPDKVIELIGKWQNQSKETDWIIKHASRGLLKRGHQEALTHFGLNHRVKAVASVPELTKTKIKIGQSIGFSSQITLKEKQTEKVRVEYKIYFMKANGKQLPKVFQVGTYPMKPGERMLIKKVHRFADLTTRKHYTGAHQLVIVVNGKEVSHAAFELC